MAIGAAAGIRVQLYARLSAESATGSGGTKAGFGGDGTEGGIDAIDAGMKGGSGAAGVGSDGDGGGKRAACGSTGGILACCKSGEAGSC